MFMDVLSGSIISVDSNGGVRRHRTPSAVSTVIRRRIATGFIIATERGVVLSDDQFMEFEEFAVLSIDEGVRTNDGGCDKAGNFIVGTMAYDERPGRGVVYCVTPDRCVTELLCPVTISNGVQWSGDGLNVYYVDSPTRRVDIFDVDYITGRWFNRRTHIALDGVAGVPDGMAVDEDGGLWVALWGGGAVNHYDPAGLLVETIKVPGVTQVSSCAFGGPCRDVLYITTSRKGLPYGQEIDAGAVFALETRVRGAKLPEFAG